MKLCKEIKADLLLATDPDSDRVGIAVKDGDDYRLITGNETGIMLSNYILENRKANGTLPENPIVVKTIVTSVLMEKVTAKYGAELKNVLTGFKYIGEQIFELEKKNEEDRFVFGFEESYGYLAGSYARDKDAVVASMLICEMAAFYKKQNKTLANVIDELYDEYGFYNNKTVSFAFKGASGMERMKQIMDSLRSSDMKEIAGYKIVKHADYLNSYEKNFETGEETKIYLPKSNVLSYSLEGGNAVIVRPSGTEPKIKIYFTGVGSTKQESLEVTEKIIEFVNNSSVFFPPEQTK